MSEHATELTRLRGMTLIAEDAQIRPAAMSHVKPSEYRYYAERAMQHMVDEITTHATALATVQALRDDALQERDQVTKELEGAKAEVERLKISERLLTNVVECLDVSGVTRVCDRGLPLSPASRVRQLRWERNQQLATARADALREVREKVEKLETHGVLPSAGFGRAFAGVDRDAVLALLGGDA